MENTYRNEWLDESREHKQRLRNATLKLFVDLACLKLSLERLEAKLTQMKGIQSAENVSK